jgi:pilus assembly protein Flp/PilA
MNTVISRVRQFLTSEDGPTAVEYAVLTGLIAVALAAAVPTLTGAISATFTTVSSTLAS